MHPDNRTGCASEMLRPSCRRIPRCLPSSIIPPLQVIRYRALRQSTMSSDAFIFNGDPICGPSGEEFSRFIGRSALEKGLNQREHDHLIAQLAESHLGGAALNWFYESLNEDIQESWKELKKAIWRRWPSQSASVSAPGSRCRRPLGLMIECTYRTCSASSLHRPVHLQRQSHPPLDEKTLKSDLSTVEFKLRALIALGS